MGKGLIDALGLPVYPRSLIASHLSGDARVGLVASHDATWAGTMLACSASEQGTHSNRTCFSRLGTIFGQALIRVFHVEHYGNFVLVFSALDKSCLPEEQGGGNDSTESALFIEFAKSCFGSRFAKFNMSAREIGVAVSDITAEQERILTSDQCSTAMYSIASTRASRAAIASGRDTVVWRDRRVSAGGGGRPWRSTERLNGSVGGFRA